MADGVDSEGEAVHSEEGHRAGSCPEEDSWVEADLAEEIVEDLVETVEALVRLEEVAFRGAAWEVIVVASGEQHRLRATYQNMLTCGHSGPPGGDRGYGGQGPPGGFG